MIMKKPQSQWKQTMIGATAAAMLTTGVLGGGAAVLAASANPFADVNATQWGWAEKHITKLALQGIVLGSNGKFRPADGVTRQEAVIIALKFMGLEDEVQETGAVAFPSSLVIKNDYKKFLKVAFQKKLLLLDEETALAEAEKGKRWGYEPATREWLSRLLVRAIDKQAAASAVTGGTAFADNAKIDPKLRGYVKVAVDEGLVSGVTPTTFEPKKAVTRATIARLFSLAEAKVNVAYEGQTKGTILSLTDTALTLLHDDGTVTDYTLNANSMLYRYDSDKAVDRTAFKLFGKANVIGVGNGVAGYVEQTDDTAQTKTYEGTLTLKNTTTGKLTLLIGEDYKPYTYDLKHPPIITDTAGKTIGQADLPVNVDVSLMVDTVRAEGKVVAVKVKQAIDNRTGNGTVVAWNEATRTLQVKDAVSGETETLAVSAQATFERADVPVKPDNLKAGDTISYEVKLGSVVSIEIAKAAVTTIAGKLYSVNKTDKTIQYLDSADLRAKFLADNATVKIEGLSDAGIDDLQKDDAVTLTLNDADKVTQISVSGRTVTTTSATVAAYIPETKTLSMTDASGKILNKQLPSNVRYDSNGATLTEAAALQIIAVKGKKIVVGYSGDNVVYVSVFAKYAGTVLENNIVSRTLKLALNGSSSQTITVPYASPTIEMFGMTGKTYADIKVGDVVTAVLNNQDQASTIQVQKTAQLDVVSVDILASKIRTKRADGTVDDWTVGSSVVLQDESGVGIALSSLAAGSVVNTTFVGNTPVKWKRVDVAYGIVKSVNASAGTIELTLPSGAVSTKTVGSSSIVNVNGSSTSLAALQPNDRVEIRKDENDRYVVQVVAGVSKEVRSVDVATRTLNVKRALLTDISAYPVTTSAYIHQGTTLLGLGDLKADDVITMYVLRGAVVEIAKQ